jgi:hypothetical protein
MFIDSRPVGTTIFILAISLAACAQANPLPTPTKTPAPLVSPVGQATAVGTPLPEPDMPSPSALAGVVLTLADLPPGFQAASPQTMSPVAAGFSQAPFFDVAGTSGFTMAHSEGPELIVTFSGSFTEDDPFRESAPATQKPRFALYMFIVGSGTQEITGDGQLEDVSGIGQEAQGYFWLANLNDRPIRVDLVVVRRGRTGFYIFHLYPQNWESATSVVALAQLLDGRLSAASDG